MRHIFPFLSWFRHYTADSLKADAVSGLTVALVLIPQSMAYAQLAGLPSYYGLYASFLPPLAASLFGSSRQLSTGPAAVVSLLTAASLEPMATAGSTGYIAYALLLTLIVGSIQLFLGVFRLGVIINFLSLPVINGFTNAAAIIIASSQLPKLLGVSVDKAEHHYETVMQVIALSWNHIHWPTFLIGMLAFCIMYGLKRTAPKIPNVLAAVVVTSLIAWGIDFHKETTVNISAIRSQKATDLIRSFNRTLEEIRSLGNARGGLKLSIRRLDEKKDALAVLRAEHRIRILTFRIHRQREAVYGFRRSLMNLSFVPVRFPDRHPGFQLKDEAQEGARTDDATWRIKVGDRPIPLNRVPMIAGGELVGTVPKGLPAFTAQMIDFSLLTQLLPSAVIISLLGFMEAISIAKAIAAKTGQRLDPNQELIGQGLANIFGSLTKSYPTSGSFGRSAVNLQSGAVSGLSGVFTSATVTIVLLFLTPLLYYLPLSVLAAIIMLAVIDLINISGFIHAWRAQWYDGAISIIVFVSTLIFAPHLDTGIFIGIGLSLLVFLYKSMRPAMASLSLYEDEALHDAVTYCLRECRFIEVVRFDGPLFYANAAYLEEQIDAHMEAKRGLKHIIIYANSINDMDATGEETLSLVVDRIRSAGLEISFAGVNRTVKGVLSRTHLAAKIGQDHFYPTIDKAITAVHARTHSKSEEEACPLTSVCRLPQ